jgi:hypothetical protein
MILEPWQQGQQTQRQRPRESRQQQQQHEQQAQKHQKQKVESRQRIEVQQQQQQQRQQQQQQQQQLCNGLLLLAAAARAARTQSTHAAGGPASPTQTENGSLRCDCASCLRLLLQNALQSQRTSKRVADRRRRRRAIHEYSMLVVCPGCRRRTGSRAWGLVRRYQLEMMCTIIIAQHNSLSSVVETRRTKRACIECTSAQMRQEHVAHSTRSGFCNGKGFASRIRGT